jgi:spore germination cell wall hydrolase CwlJ-like protein
MFGLVRAGGFAAALGLLASFSMPSLAQAAPAEAAAQLSPVPGSQSAAGATVSAVSGAHRGSAPSAMSSPRFSVAAPAAAQAARPTVAQQHRPLHDLVISFVDFRDQDSEEMCLVKAIYFEARSETIEGQLAVAEVILNRTASGLYPTTICGVVTQPAQFSFIRAGRFPTPDTKSEGWRKALAIADIAINGRAQKVAPNVLWYHATYVAPSWGRRLTRVARIGTHIFYS